MKKFLPYILTLVVIVNLFAPFSVTWKDNKAPIITKNEAKAGSGVSSASRPKYEATDKTISATYEVKWETFNWATTETIVVLLKEGDPSTTDETKIKSWVEEAKSVGDGVSNNTITFSDLKPDTDYYIQAKIGQKDPLTWKNVVFGASPAGQLLFDSLEDNNTVSAPSGSFDKIHTNTAGDTNINTTEGDSFANQDAFLPACSIIGGNGTFLGCMVQLYYFALFVPTAFLFGLAGKFFDWVFAYSISDTSYRSAFVINGWAIVRDICNIFFIFVLLYAAFKMIFGSHGAKSVVVNVIIIGVLINFSLFATQVLIDSSNILARLFYTSQAIKITADNASGNYNRGGVSTTDDAGLGELSLSAALVTNIDPQKIIIESSKVTLADDASGSSGTADQSGEGIGVGAFFLITTMAIIVNVVGMFVFLSVGLIFISRVIGLWMAMVFAPLAFFSYTVPSLSKTKIIGWKSWWSDTLGMCFVAPIFMFFLYLILLFIQGGFKNIIKEQDGPNWVLSIIIPFIFIMVLLLTAKKLAKEYSGSIGQTITGAVSAVGGVALGGAALGTAMLGRKVIGGALSRASRGETATQKYEAGTAKGLGKVTGFVGSKIGMGRIFGNTYDVKTKTVSNGIGGILNKKQRSVGDVDHARSDIDKAKEAAHLGGVADSRLSGENVQAVKKEFNKMKKGDVESSLRKGEDLKGNKITQSEDEFKKAYRQTAITDHEKSSGRKEKNFTDADKKAVENTINVQYNDKLKKETNKMLEGLFDHTKNEAKGYDSAGKKVTQIDRIISKANTGSYDVRNLSDSKSDKRANVLTKMGVGAIAGIALGVRTGLKGIFDVNHGKGQGDFLKDLGHTIKEAMKGVKIQMPSGGGHGGGHDDHGGGHDDHGGGHGGGHH